MTLNLEKSEHKNLTDDIENLLQESGPLPTPKLARKAENHGGWSDDYLRHRLLPAALNHLKENNKIEESHRKPEGGQETIYWNKK